jgi:hypothetical protein
MRLAVSCSCEERGRMDDSWQTEKIDGFFHTAEEFKIVGADLNLAVGHAHNPGFASSVGKKLPYAVAHFRRFSLTAERIFILREAGDFCRLIQRAAGGNSYKSGRRSADSFNCFEAGGNFFDEDTRVNRGRHKEILASAGAVSQTGYSLDDLTNDWSQVHTRWQSFSTAAGVVS